jgi:polyisoprenyl-phosphate glycosyltransferase
MMPLGEGAPSRLAAIVPAYNEQETLADVVSVLKATPPVDEVLVVSDGSTDETVSIARALGVRVIHLKRNHGKGMAMAMGVAHTTAPILLFLDGDILNLSDYLIESLVAPVVAGRSAMNVGVRNRGWLINSFHRTFGPLLSGQRCLRREVFEAVPADYLRGFAIETALNWACRRLRLARSTTVLYGLEHRVKEKKRGLAEGVRARFEMFGAVLRAYLRLRFERPLPAPGGGVRPPIAEPDYITF